MGQIVGQKLRIKNKLTSLALKKITQPRRYSDGNNLYLKVEATNSVLIKPPTYPTNFIAEEEKKVFFVYYKYQKEKL